MIKKYKTGLVIGRFQPFHNGHKYLIQKALENVEKIIIGIGSANANDENNPYSFEQRKKMLEEFISQEEIGDRVVKIFPSNDIADDDKWAKQTTQASGKIDIIISNNDSGVNVFFEKLGYEILRIPYYKREIYEGWRIRKLMREGEAWEDRVPDYLVSQIKSFEV